MRAVMELKSLMRLKTVRSAVVPFGATVCATIAVASGPAQASTFTFNDMDYISSSTQFGNSFPGYGGPPNYSSAGFYDVLATTTGKPWDGTTTNAPTYVGRTPSLKDYIQNDPNFTGTPGSQFTTSADSLNMPTGWTTVGGTVNGAVANGLKNSSTSPGSIYFLGTAGSQTSFLFNQIVLSGTGTFDLQVRNASNTPLLPGSGMLITLSSTAQTILLELAGAYNIDFNNLSTGASVVVKSVEINDAIATPLPGALPLFATGLVGLGLLGWYRKRKAVV